MMNKSKLIERVHFKMHLCRAIEYAPRDYAVTEPDVVHKAINAMLEQISDSLSNDGRVEIRNFGSFKVKRYEAERRFTNPRDPSQPIHKVTEPRIAFKAGLGLRRGVDYFKPERGEA